MLCQSCGQLAPTRKVEFHQHTGLLILMRHGRIGGHFCKACILKHFGQTTGWTALAGWWGMASMFITPFVLLWNTGVWLTSQGLASPEPHNHQLSLEAAQRIEPFGEQIFSHLGQGIPIERIANSIAPHAQVTPVEVALWIQAVLSATRR